MENPFALAQIKKSFNLFLVLIFAINCSAQVSGKVFRDFNANGTIESTGSYKETLVPGVVVKAYNNSGTLVALYITTSFADVSGNNFSFPASGLNSIAPGATVRLEFSNLGAGNYVSRSSAGSAVQFVTAPAANIKLGVNYPKEYSQATPTLVTNLFVEGQAPAATGLPVLVSVPYTANGASNVHKPEAVHTQIGATWGLAWHRASRKLFAAAYQKRHTSYGSGNSTGVIYKLDNPADGLTTGVSVFLDLNTLYGSNVAGNNPHPNATANFQTDEASYGVVGKIALGGIDISEDEKFIWAVNLNDRQLYKIPLGNDPLNPVAPTLSSQITRYPLFNKCDCNGNGSPDGVADTDLRPFAVKAWRGKVYVGMVCTAQSTPTDFSKLRAYVFEMNPATGSFTQVLTFPLNYNRGSGNTATGWYVSPVPGGYTAGNTANWRPWDDVYSRSKLSWYDAGWFEGGYCQPMFSDIAFDADGNMHIGLRDRFGDMVGDGVNEPGGSATLLESDGNGDILRATPALLGGWTMNMAQATHGTEFYAGDEFGGQHQETCNGGLAIQSGTGQVVYTVMDPLSNLSSGLDWANTSTGALDRSYQVYRRNSGAAATDYYFGKSNGNGDVECLSDAAPVEIGNRVWNDADADGVQDANEAGIANVTIELFTDFNLDAIPDGPAIASVVTNANGEWYFGNANMPDGDPFTPGNQPGFKYGRGYIARIAASDWLMGPGNGINDLAGLQLTIPDATSTGETDLADNDAWLTNGGTIVPQIIIVPMMAGQNNFDYDFGFTALSFLPVQFTGISAEKTNNNKVTVKWNVANEEPRTQYIVERSANGINFSAIGTVAAAGTSGYSFADAMPGLDVKNYYRVRQTSASGREVLSEIRWVKFGGDARTDIYPNPVVNTLNIVVNDITGNVPVTAVLYGMNGKQVKTQTLYGGMNTINMTALASGTYQLLILDGNGIKESRKIVKQ